MATAPMPTEPTDLELDYRAKNYQDSEAIERKQIVCATCGKNLSAKIEKPGCVFVHPFMRTLQCKKCSDFYGDGDFSMDEDGDDKYCRMCGNGGELYICGKKPCPYGFCQKCIDRYVGMNSSEVQADDWKCLHCNCRPLWEVRAVCATIILENPRKRRKQRKKSTRDDVSNDDYSRSRDSDNEIQSSKRVIRRPLRSGRNVNKRSLDKLRKICDNSEDSSDLSHPLHESIAGKTDSNTRSKDTDFTARQSFIAKKNVARSSKRSEKLSKKLTSSGDDTSDFEEKQVGRKKKIYSTVHNIAAEPESKSAKQRNTRSSIQSRDQKQKLINHSSNHPKASESRGNFKNSTKDSDDESSSESASDFVKSRKKNKAQELKAQKEKSSKEDSTVQKEKSNDCESSSSKWNRRRPNTKFEKVLKRRRTRESSLEPKRTNRKSGNSSTKVSNTNTISKNTAKCEYNASESDEEMVDIGKCANPNEGAALPASGENKRHTDSENEENQEDQNAKVYAKVSTSSTMIRELQEATLTEKLSTKPRCPTPQLLSALDYNNEFLDRKKASIKQSYARFESTKDCLIKNEATIIQDHVGSLISEMKMFGKSVCTGANVIATKHLTSNVESVPAVSKVVLKCALLMIRCKKSLNVIEHEFISCYENWCKNAKVKSIFAHMENTDIATNDEVDSIIEEETSIEIGKTGGIGEDSKAERNIVNSVENSYASNDGENHVPSPTRETGKTDLDIKEISVDASENSYTSKSTEIIEKNEGDSIIRDSNEVARNSQHDAMSDCDSREIFSDNGSEGRDNIADEPTTEIISIPSSPANESKKRSIESDTDDENLNKVREKSSQSDNEIESPKNTSQNHRKDKDKEKIIKCAAEKSTEQLSRDERSLENTNSSMGDIFDDTTASDINTTSNLNKESKRLGNSDVSVINYSGTTENLSISEESAAHNTEVTENNLSNTRMTDDEETIDPCNKLPVNKQKSKHDNKPKISGNDSSMNANENVENLSDCDATMIFTQLPSDTLTTNSNANHVPESTEFADNLDGTEDLFDAEMPLGNDINCKDDVVSPSKKKSHSPVTVSKEYVEVNDSDTNKNLKSVSNGLKSYKNRQEHGKVIANHTTALSMANESIHSKEDIAAVDGDGIGESEQKEATAVDDESEEATAVDDKSKEATAVDDESEKATAVDDELEEATAVDDESKEATAVDDELEKATVVDDELEEATAMDDELEEATAVDDESKEATAVDDELEKATVVDDELEEATAMDDELAEATAVDDESNEATAVDDELEEATAVDDELERATAVEDESEEATVVDDKLEEATAVDDKLEEVTVVDDKLEEAPAVDDELEEAIKKKILESDSDWSDESTAISNRSNSFKLKVDSDSEEYIKELVSANITKAKVTSDVSSIDNLSKNLTIELDKSEINTTNSSSVDINILELNNRAKHRLLSSSDSSSSLTSPENLHNLDSLSTSSRENNEIDPSSVNNTSSMILSCSKAKRKKFNLEKNYYYKTDKKLQVDCEVVLRRLNEKVLDQFRQLLGKFKERQELEDFESLVDLSNIKKRKRGTKGSNQSGSSSDSSKASSRGLVKKVKSKQVQEKEETLLDHLENMKNGENYCNLSGDDSDENNDIIKSLLPDENDQDEFLTEANKLAKDLLIQSSDSENEKENLIETAEEQEPREKLKPETQKKNDRDTSNEEEAVGSESNHENGSNAEEENEETTNAEEDVDLKENDDSDRDRTRERKKMKEGLAKRNWRLTDSDSSSEERKWNKSQLKKSDEKRSPKNEDGPKNKKKVKRRVLGSDSDSVKLTDLSDSSVEMLDNKKSGSSASEDSSEMFKNLRKKRRRKRNAAQKSDSDSDSDSDQDEKPSKLKRKRIKKMASDSDSDNDTLTNSQDTPGKLHRKNIRKVLKDKQVADVTKIAGKEEEERLRRIAERQKLYNEMYEMKLASEAKVDKLVLDFDEETKKELISVHEDLVKRLKPHQAQGIKFMWDACFESLERIKSSKGSGCIVAHCMGLGKTFQVVTLAHTLLTHAETGIKTIMVICPLSTVLNWVNEFKKWLGDINNDEDVEVFEMTKMKKNFERKFQLEKWKRAGGVMVLGYEMFRLLSNQTGKKMRKSLHEGILKCLVDPGPDLIVCDEGHLLKNEDTALSKAMRRVKTLRRVVLTGTPLQNNLVEYHCMVQFVKPNLLGTKKEFLNRFVNPITNGQFDDSTEYDVKLMKKRAHVLHKMLEGSVQRFDYSVLTPFLPPKQEYVITVRLADIQIKLYQYYLDNFSRKKVGAGTSLFADFQALQRIWTHPIVLRMNAEKVERLNEKKRMDASDDSEGSLRDFLDDGSEDKTTSSDDSDIQSAHSSDEEKTEKPDKPRRGTRANPVDSATAEEEEEEIPQSGEWWSQFVESEHFEDMKVSSKLVLLFAILKECEQIGDKVLVFSQSLYALSLIEEFLNKIDDETQRGTSSELIDGHSGSWSLGLDYFRLDGQTAPENRSHYCKIFNNPKNSRARLFLISTRAGGLGINLTAANRVIIFDASWNPSHDVQSIFRIYRFGQKKPCYVYRFLAQGTMEEKIYNRQVTKLSLSCRVVDEQQIERHYSNHDLAELYQFEPNTSMEKPTLNLPKDRLLAEIFRKYEDRIETFHEHDSLLENKAEEELDEEERKEAWKEYEDERKGRKVYMNNFSNQNFAMQQYNGMMNMNQADIANRATLSGINIETLEALIRKDYPNTTPEQQKMMTQRAILDMYTYMESEAIRQQQMAAAASNFTYPTVSNIGTSSFIDGNVPTLAQRQYAMQQQHQILVQREQQANYAKRFGNVRGPALSATATRPPPVVNLQDDNDVIEVPTTPPLTAGPIPSSSVQTPSVSTAPAAAENSKRQEE